MRRVVLNLILIVAGFLFLILIMAFILNPPEAWVKRAFQGKNRQQDKRVKD
jgi:hypothetical protein